MDGERVRDLCLSQSAVESALRMSQSCFFICCFVCIYACVLLFFFLFIIFISPKLVETKTNKRDKKNLLVIKDLYVSAIPCSS